MKQLHVDGDGPAPQKIFSQSKRHTLFKLSFGMIEVSWEALALKFLYFPAAGDEEGRNWFPALIAPALRPRAAGLVLLIQIRASSSK